MLTFFNHFPQRISDVTTQLTTQGIPLTSSAVPATAPDDPGTSSRPVPPVDRTTLAWCTAAQMLSAHHRTPLSAQVLSADALIRERGVRRLARPTPTFTTALPDCAELGCPPQYEFIGHDHICPVCMGADCQPEWFGEERITELDRLVDAPSSGVAHGSLGSGGGSAAPRVVEGSRRTHQAP